ncbi:MAG: 16S rRNA (cytidine(1402)-2'-O)-methyltransferase [Acidobacteriales bacterium]|nr:16S rRNA (cytidine(1402)-2'-O)-methyltransferase [Terriglobales bacterium]
MADEDGKPSPEHGVSGGDGRSIAILEPGLYLVATPIGNLADISLRALEVLNAVNLIACEDTRHTQKLLNHYGVTTRTISYHQHNEIERATELVAKLQQGERIALVSDAGTPPVSDPGFRLITQAIEHGVRVIPVPGACAFLAALAASGLPPDSFSFHGFLPSKPNQRRQILQGIAHSQQTEIFYEAPHRITAALEEVVEILGGSRRLVLARELTKVHEEFLRGTAAEILETLKNRGEIKGEITLLIAKAGAGVEIEPSPTSVKQRLEQLMEEEKLDEKAALKKIAKEKGISKSKAYREIHRG